MLYALGQIENEYKSWIEENEGIVNSNGKKRVGTFFSIIILCADVEIIGQINGKFEIVRSSKEKVGEDVARARGEYFLVIDQSGKIESDVLNRIKNSQIDEGVQLLYADEDVLIEGERCHPFFKPDWSPHTLQSFFYLGSAVFYRKDLLEMLVNQLDGTWNRDAIAKILVQGLNRNQVRHYSEILYHNIKTQEKILENSKYDSKRKILYNHLVSIIIPSKDHLEVLRKCIDSVRRNTIRQLYEIIVVDNGSEEKNRIQIEQYLKSVDAKYCYEKEKFNFSKMCNRGVEQAKGDYLLFLNDDIEILQPDWLDNMLELAVLPYSGAVGAKLLYPEEKRIQHVGIINLQSGPSHAFLGEKDADCYFGRNRVDYNYLAVTGACLLVEREKYLKVGGMEEQLPVAYNDVDLCFKLYEAGWYNVVCNRTKIMHYESLSRGLDAYDEKKMQRLCKERDVLFDLHPGLIGKDPFYNKNLVTDKENFKLNIPKYEFRMPTVFSIKKEKIYAYQKLNIVIDRVSYDNDILIEGWCQPDGTQSDDIDRKFVIQMDEAKVLLLDMETVEREDVWNVVGGITRNLGFKIKIPAALRQILNYAIRIGIWEKSGENADYFGELENKFSWEKLQKRKLAVQIPRDSMEEWKKRIFSNVKIEIQNRKKEYCLRVNKKLALNTVAKVVLVPDCGGILCIDMEQEGERLSGKVKKSQVNDIAKYQVYLLEEKFEKREIVCYRMKIKEQRRNES